MKKESLLNSFSPSFNSLPVGTSERLIHSYWELGMKRFHTYSDVCSTKLKGTYNQINHHLGVESIDLDLDSLGNEYRDESSVLSIIRGERPTWIWFNNCNALLNTSLAGWLRSVLTTYYVDHVRVVFVLDSKEQCRSIFKNYSAPLYQSTIPLELIDN